MDEIIQNWKPSSITFEVVKKLIRFVPTEQFKEIYICLEKIIGTEGLNIRIAEGITSITHEDINQYPFTEEKFYEKLEFLKEKATYH